MWRITPAPAGNTPSPSINAMCTWDHPRACGKHLGRSYRARLRMGSPPRLRETQLVEFEGRKYSRITPAPAGNTYRHRGSRHVARDHPRACGKHRGITFTVGWQEGSPPRLRETLPQRFATGTNQRITPAPAGNTCVLFIVFGFSGDHPRACGKHGRQKMCTSLT